MSALEATADFLQVIAVSFQNAHSTRTKHAFAEVLVELLEPVAVVMSADANFPSWTKTVDMIYPRVYKMAQKPRHFHVAVPLLTTLLSVAPKSLFLNHLNSLVELIIPRLKERAMVIRRLALSCWVRLVWLYIFRCPDTTAGSVNRRLDATFRTLFPARGRGIFPPDTVGAADSLTRLIVYVGARYWDYAIDGLILPLLNYDAISSSNLLVSSVSWITGLGAGTGTTGVSGSQASLLSPVAGSANSLIVGNDAENAFEKLLATYEHLLSPERQGISLRAFYSILAEMERAFALTAQSSASMTHAVSRSVHRGGLGATGDASRVQAAPPPTLSPLPIPLLVEVSPSGQPKSLSGDWEFLRRASTSVATASASNTSVSYRFVEKYRTRTVTGDHYRDNIAEINVVLPPQFWAKAGFQVRSGYEKVCTVLGRLLALLDLLVGSLNLGNESGAVQRETTPALSNQPSTGSIVSDTGSRSLSSAVINATTSLLPGSLRKGGSQVSLSSTGSAEELEAANLKDLKDMPRNKAMLIDLLRTCIDGLPRCTPKAFSPFKLLEMLCKYTMHIDEGLRRASLEALRRILRISDPAERMWWLGADQTDTSPGGVPASCLAARMTRIFMDALTWTSNERIGDFISMRGSADELETRSSTDGLGSLLMFATELAEAWYAELANAVPETDAGTWEAMLDEIEQWGLLQLCSSSPGVRRYGIRMLKLASNMMMPAVASNLAPKVVVGSRNRILPMLDAAGPRILASHDGALVSACDAKDLVALACSLSADHQTLWLKCFPDVAREIFTNVSQGILLGNLENISRRITQLQPSILAAAELGATAGATSSFYSYRNFLPGGRSGGGAGSALSATDDMILQWRYYVVFICCCQTESSTTTTSSPHSRPPRLDLGPSGAKGFIYGPRQLFQLLLPLLAAEKATVRLAAVTALGSVHPTVFGLLYQEAQPLLRTVLDEGLARVGQHSDPGGTIRSLSLTTPRRSFTVSSANLFGGLLGPALMGRRADRLRAEIAQLFALTIGLLRHEECGNDAFLLQGLLQYVVETARFLVDPIIQAEWDHQMLRYYFTSFVQKLYETLAASTREGLIPRSSVGTPSGAVEGAPQVRREHDPRANKAAELVRRMMSYEIRHVLFKLVENWCGFGMPSLSFRDRQSRTIAGILDSIRDTKERQTLSSAMDEQRRALEQSACRALCSLCRGPISPEGSPKDVDSATRSTKVLMEPSVVDELRNLAAVLGIQVNGQTLPFDVDSLVQFIDASLTFVDERTTGTALGSLEALLSSNPNNAALVDKAIRQAYGHRTPASSRCYFLALARVFKRLPGTPIGLAKLMALSLIKMSDPDVTVRREAHALGVHLGTIERGLDSDEGRLLQGFLSASIVSDVTQSFLMAQAMMSTALALIRPDLTNAIISELTFWSDTILTATTFNQSALMSPGKTERNRIRDLISILVPWARNAGRQTPQQPVGAAGLGIELPATESAGILTNLFYLTAKFGEDCVVEIHKLWSSFVGASDLDSPALVPDLGLQIVPNPATPEDIRRNTTLVCQYVLRMGAEHRNPVWMVPAKRIAVALSRSFGCRPLIENLVCLLTATNMVPGHVGATDLTTLADHTPLSAPFRERVPLADDPRAPPGLLALPLHVADVSKVVPVMLSNLPVSVGQLSSLLFGEILPELPPDDIITNLPLVLHLVIVHLDQMGSYLGEEHRNTLLTLFRLLCADEKIDNEAAELERAIEKPRFWAYEDVSPDHVDISSFAPLAALVYQVVNFFSKSDPALIARWGELALNWSTLCPVRHIACRSLQIYRALLPPTPVARLGELLLRLSRGIADKRAEAQGFAIEVLVTLRTLFGAMDRDQFLAHPQFFWVAVGVLSSPHDWEFGQGLDALDKMLSFVDLEDVFVQDLIYECLPTGWAGNFSGLQPLLLRGLSSPNFAEQSLKLINRLLSIRMDALVDLSQGRMLFVVLANLPLLVAVVAPTQMQAKNTASTTQRPAGSEWIDGTQRKLATALRGRKQESIAQLIENCAKPRYFRSKEDFLKNLVPLLADAYPDFVMDAVVFLLSLLQIPDRQYRLSVLQVLKTWLGCVNVQRFTDVIASERALTPLYQAAKGENSALAVEVLNELMLRDQMDRRNGTTESDSRTPTPRSEISRSTPSASGDHRSELDISFDSKAKITKSNVAAIAQSFIAQEIPIEGNDQDDSHPTSPLIVTHDVPVDVSLVDLVPASSYPVEEVEAAESPVVDSEDRLVLADELIGRHLRGEPAVVEPLRPHHRSATSTSIESLSPPLPLFQPMSYPASPGSSFSSQESLPIHMKTQSQASKDSS